MPRAAVSINKNGSLADEAKGKPRGGMNNEVGLIAKSGCVGWVLVEW